MKNQDIMAAYEGLNSLRKAATQRLPARVSFAVIRNMKLFQPIVEDIQTTYNELITRYAVPIEGENNQFKVKDEFLDTFNKEMKDLYTTETDLPIVKIKFSDIEALDFSLSETEALYFMIDDWET